MRSLPSGWITFFAKLGWTKDKSRTHKRQGHDTKRLRMERLEDRWALAITVDVPFDERDFNIFNNDDVSLRDAILEAGPNETINFAPSLNGVTIPLTLGEIAFSKNLTIDASMLPNGITIDAGDTTPTQGDGIRIFNITDTSNPTDPPSVTMIGLELTGADPALNAGGGAIRSEGLLTLRDMQIHHNDGLIGAGVYLDVRGSGPAERDVLVIEDSCIEHNSALWSGGAVHVRFNSQFNEQDKVRIDGSELSHNTAQTYYGGALSLESNGNNGRNAVIITSSLLDDNSAAKIGGGIFYNPSARIDLSILQDSTISGNHALAGSGGGIHANGRSGSTLRIEDSNISGNTSSAAGGGVSVLLDHAASLNIERSTVSLNTAGGDGGGVHAVADNQLFSPLAASPAVTVSKSIISENSASNRGGGLFVLNFHGTETLVRDSRFTYNHATSGNGGGIYTYVFDQSSGAKIPRFTITGSTVDNNDANQKGGGIFVCGKFFGEFIATNTTVSGNRTLDSSTGAGGGMMIARFGEPGDTDEFIDAHLRNVTVTQNSSKDGGGINAANLLGVEVFVGNSIISENFNHTRTAPNNFVGRIVAAEFKHNLVGMVGTGSAFLDHVTGNSVAPNPANLNILNNNTPMLTPLANRGGPTPTHSLVAGSPAIDAGSNALDKDPLTNVALTTDQRGTKFPRRFNVPGVRDPGDVVDIGAYEVGLAKVIDVIISSSDPNVVHAPYRFSEAFADGIHELRTVPVAGADTIEIVFSEWVNVDATDLYMKGRLTLTTYTTAWNIVDFLPCDPQTFTARWRFDDPDPADGDLLPDAFPPDQLRFTLNDSTGRAVSDAYGNRLDGEFFPPGNLSAPSPPSLTSGNGVASGMFMFWCAILPGDLDQDNDVDGSDWMAWQLKPQGGTDRTFTDGDFDGDGDVDGDDFALLLDNYGIQLVF
jgi:hypothetical protein